MPRHDNNDDLLVTWKDIAAYLKCSVRKAQRLEAQALPVNRIPGTKSVWALKPEVDQWLASHAERTSRGDERGETEARLAAALRRFSASRGWAWALAISLTITVAATAASRYAAAIASFGLTAALGVSRCSLAARRASGARFKRALLALLMIAGMSYSAVATTLPGWIDSVVNMDVLRPALAYPFAMGLRFIPIPILIAFFWALADSNGPAFAGSSRLRTAFLGLAVLFLALSTAAGVAGAGLHRIWQAGLPIRWTLLVGESFVLAVNLVMFAGSYRFFSRSTRNFMGFGLQCGMGCLLIALTAAILGRHWNEIDRYYLDIHRPQAYRVQNVNAADDLQHWLHRGLGDGLRRGDRAVGPDLARLFNDPEFLHALQTRKFYRVDFDEAFQAADKAVIFGYKADRGIVDHRPAFVLVRFPADLAAVLRFEQTNEDH